MKQDSFKSRSKSWFKPARSSRMARKEALEGYFFILPWLIGLLAFTLGPVLVSFYLSFNAWQISAPPKWIGLTNYAELIKDPAMRKSLYNTLYLTVFGVPVNMIAGLAIAL